MPTITHGKRTLNGKSQVIIYAGKNSLLELVEEFETSFFNGLETAARNGWITPEKFAQIEDDLEHFGMKFDLLPRPD